MNQKTTRKLAAIMFTDIEGFTEMMQKDEGAGLMIRKRHKDAFEKYHQAYNGEIIQYWGDGTLSIFPNSVDAINCAVDIQKDLAKPLGVPLRIGIHSGNIVIEPDGNGIIGDAVNIASRIESFSVPGAVLISDTVHDQVRNQAEFGFVSLGRFNFKNVSRPFDLYAISGSGLVVPRPESLQGKGEKAGGIGFQYPLPATPMLGRKKELDELCEMIGSAGVVTITGAGGMGKTTMAMKICQRLEPDFPDGIRYISMETITDGAWLIPAVADALGIKQAEGRTLEDALSSFIFDKEALLVLDNLEQVISAAPAIAGLISKCPNLRILATSRTPLRIRAEKEYALFPLSLPDLQQQTPVDALMDYPAIALFVERAKRVKSNFTLTLENGWEVARICQRVDGLPLAIELAAARIRMMPPAALLQRLNHALDLLTTGGRDLPERHQTLRAAIDWSHDLLTNDEKLLFRRISVFADTFTLEGVEATCYEDHPEEALDHLESLIDKGLVQPLEEDSRFKMLQTIKEYATEKQAVAGDGESISRRHAAHYRNVVRQLSRGICTPDQVEWVKNGPAEEANIRVALDFLLSEARKGEAGSAEAGLAICGDLFMYWHMRGNHIQGHEYASSFLNSAGCPESSLEKSSALLTASLCSWTLGHFEKSMEETKTAYEMAQLHQGELETILAETLLAVGYLGIDPELAAGFTEKAAGRARSFGNQYHLGQSLVFNGIAHLILGKIDTARDRFHEVLGIYGKSGDQEAGGLALSSLAVLSAMNKNFAEAISLYEQSLTCFESIGDHAEEARVHSEMGWTCLGMKDIGKSHHHFNSSIQLYEKVGSIRGIGLALIGIAAIETVELRHKRAVEIATAAEIFIEQGGIVNVYTDDFPGRLYIEHARQELDAEDLERSVAKGKKLSVKEALLLSTVVNEPSYTA